MSHPKATSKQKVVNLRKIYGKSGYGEVRQNQVNEGGHWLPRSGGAMPSKKDKARDRKADRKAIYNMTGIWVK